MKTMQEPKLKIFTGITNNCHRASEDEWKQVTSDGNPFILSYSIPKGSFKSIPRLKLYDLTESRAPNGSFRLNICSARVNRLRYPDLIEVKTRNLFGERSPQTFVTTRGLINSYCFRKDKYVVMSVK